MGGGLVLFGVGGNVSGGLLDALKNNPSSSNSDLFTKRLKAAEKLVGHSRRTPRPGPNVVSSATRWPAPATATTTTTGAFTTKGKAELAAVDQAWNHYLNLDPKKIDPTAANYMVNAYAPNALNQTDKLVRAYELVIDATAKPTFDQYRNLAIYSYVAGQTRKGDLARGKALELAPKDQRAVVKQQIDAQKTEAIKQAIQSGGRNVQSGG